ncbi:MAG: hypothetical protein ACTSSP_01110 [Candidatus Asgardarchaeia archaeon]
MRKYTEEEMEALYQQYHPLFVGLTTEEKEDKLVEMVSAGELSADQALILAIKESLDITT